MLFPLAKLPPAQTPSRHSSVSDKDTASATGSVTSSVVSSLSVIPDHWRPEVEECFKAKSLTSGAQDAITQTLGNILFSRSKKPTRADCDDISKKTDTQISLYQR